MNPVERDRDMVRSPYKWVAFPLLPLKHRRRKFNDDDSFGFILAGNPCKVYVARMYFAISKLSGKNTWAEAIEGMPTQHYPSVEALTDDWTVAAMPISKVVLLIIVCSRLHQSATPGATSEQTRRMHHARRKPKRVQMSDYPYVRILLKCPLCGREKPRGLLLCWPCHSYETRHNHGGYSQDSVDVVDGREECLRLQAHQILAAPRPVNK